MPAGRLIGTLFFLLLIFAALTPSLACIEPLVSWLQQRKGMSRVRAALTAGLAAWLAGIASMLSFNRWSGVRPLAWIPGFANKNIFDTFDYVSSNLLLPLGALATSIFVGWFASRAIVSDQLSETTPLWRSLTVVLLRYVCPLAIATVFIASFI